MNFPDRKRVQMAVINSGAGTNYLGNIAAQRGMGFTVVPQPGGWAAVYR